MYCMATPTSTAHCQIVHLLHGMHALKTKHVMGNHMTGAFTEEQPLEKLSFALASPRASSAAPQWRHYQ